MPGVPAGDNAPLRLGNALSVARSAPLHMNQITTEGGPAAPRGKQRHQQSLLSDDSAAESGAALYASAAGNGDEEPPDWLRDAEAVLQSPHSSA